MYTKKEEITHTVCEIIIIVPNHAFLLIYDMRFFPSRIRIPILYILFRVQSLCLWDGMGWDGMFGSHTHKLN